MHVQNMVKFYHFVLEILSGNEILNVILTSFKDHNYYKCAKMMRNNPNLDPVKLTISMHIQNYWTLVKDFVIFCKCVKSFFNP